MPDLKINDKVYNGVEKVQIPLADDSGNAEFIQPVIEALTVTENGTIEAPDGVNGYSPVVVNIPMPAPVIQLLEVTENGTYSAPDGVDGYSPVIVNVEASGGANIQSGSFTPAENLTEYTIPVDGTVKNFAFFRENNTPISGQRTIQANVFFDMSTVSDANFILGLASNGTGTSISAMQYRYGDFYQDGGTYPMAIIENGSVTVKTLSTANGSGFFAAGEKYNWIAW